MKKVKIIVSIPIHEAIDVAINQAENIKKYVRDVIVIFHASIELENDYRLQSLEKMDGVYVNPIHLKTGWGEIVETHIVNFEFANANWDFEYFVVHSSNDMYIRGGLYEYISKYKAGFNLRAIDNDNSLWVVAEPARNDETLNRLRKVDKAYASQIEGSFYSKELMIDIVKRLKEEMPFEKAPISYTREELFFSTVAASLLKEKEIGRPTTFSEVHRFDRIYQKYYRISNTIFANSQNSTMKSIIDNLIRRALFRSKVYAIKRKDIIEIRKKNIEYVKKNGRIDDGQGEFFLYEDSNVFSVKRVPRNMKSHLRQYINDLDGGKIRHEN